MALTPALLVDKSALVRLADGHPLPEGVELVICAVTRLEVLFSARSPEDYEAVQGTLDAFRELRMDAETFAVATTAQRELAASSHHRIPVPDLLIAACAHQHSAGVLHVDRHFETLNRVLQFEAVRL